MDMEMCFLPTISHSPPSFLSWVGKQVTIDGVSACPKEAEKSSVPVVEDNHTTSINKSSYILRLD